MRRDCLKRRGFSTGSAYRHETFSEKGDGFRGWENWLD